MTNQMLRRIIIDHFVPKKAHLEMNYGALTVKNLDRPKNIARSYMENLLLTAKNRDKEVNNQSRHKGRLT